jgi:3-oxoacyl-[acyl-carrier protein] reductase
MKRAIVTGCSRGIGRAMTKMLLAEGWWVTGVSRTDPALDHDAFWGVEYDLGASNADPWELPFLLGVDGFDALIHCAGIRGPYGPFVENKAEAWERTIATNLLGTARIVRAALPALQRSDDARILLFSGGGAFSPEAGYSAYAASKGATVALMETLAAELRDTSVAVNCVAPGFVATDIHAGTPHEGKSDGGEAMGRAVACVRHLLSPATHGLTGRTISAAYDDWLHLNPWTIPLLGPLGTRDRHKVARLEHLLIHTARAI